MKIFQHKVASVCPEAMIKYHNVKEASLYAVFRTVKKKYLGNFPDVSRLLPANNQQHFIVSLDFRPSDKLTCFFMCTYKCCTQLLKR